MIGKIQTAQIKEKIYDSLISLRYFLEEQNACHKEAHKFFFKLIETSWIILEMIDGRTRMNKTEDNKVNDDVSFYPKDGIDYMPRKDGKNLL